MSGNRSKKNGKKNKFLNTPEVLQVQSVKLETNRASKKGKNNTKSEDNLRKCRKSNILKGESNEDESNEGVDELETSIMKKFKKLTLNNEGENNVPSTSLLKTSIEDTCADSKKVNNKTDEELPLMMKYCPELGDDTADKYDEQYACTYKCYNKNTKSIKFTDEVTVLYFNGDEILSESMEPLKKEHDQQLRNKEMRKDHLMKKGKIDNLYLF